MPIPYKVLGVVEFANALLDVEDMEGCYVAMARVWPWGDCPQLRAWLTANAAFDNVGVASWMSDQLIYDGPEAFWRWMRAAVRREPGGPHRWLRGTNRRHFYGAEAERVLDDWQSRHDGDPGGIARHAIEGGDRNAHSVFRRIRENRGMGPYAAFKMLDLIDAVLDVTLDFTNCADIVSDVPAKVAFAYWESQHLPGQLSISRSQAVQRAFDMVRAAIGPRLVPPRYKHPITDQDIETVFCKWGHHRKGRYPVGRDTAIFYTELEPWTGSSPTAQAIRGALPPRRS